MSTENFNDNNNGTAAVKAFAAFFIASLVIHAALMWSLASLSPVYKLFDQAVLSSKEKDEPVPVEVVELPPGPASVQKPKKSATRFSDRNNVTEKETVPEKQPDARSGRYSAARPTQKAVLPAGAPQAKQSIKNPSAQAIQAKPAPEATSPAQSKKTSPAPQPSPGIKSETHEDSETIKVKGATKPLAAPLQKAQTDSDVKRPEPAALPLQQANANTTTATTGEKDVQPQTKHAKPNLFLPGEKVEELTKNYEKDAPLAEKGKVLDLNTSEWRYQSYLINSVKRRIEIYWEFPEAAIRNGWQGKVNINFTINRDGSLSNVGVARSSGYPALDDAAMTAIRLAGPFPQFPDNFAVENLTIKGQFEYHIH